MKISRFLKLNFLFPQNQILASLLIIFLFQTCNLPTLQEPSKFWIFHFLVRNSKVNSLSNLVYAGSPYSFTRNSSFTQITPSFQGNANEFSVNPELPTGLNIDPITGVLSGTPTILSNEINYTVTAKNSQNSTSTSFQLAVVEASSTVTSSVLGIWSQEAYIKPPNSSAGDEFGEAISISSDTIVVGAHFESSNQTTITNGTTASIDTSAVHSGAVYVFRRTGSSWTQEAYIKSSNSNANDELGTSIAIDSDTIVVGARNEDSNQTTITNGTTASADNSFSGSGAVYVFRRTGTTWSQEAYLKSSNSETGDLFGTNVAIDTDTIAVGVCSEDSNQTTITNGTTASADNSFLGSGAVYVFRRTGTTWIQEAYLKAPNADTGDQFCNVSISSDTIAVGSAIEESNQTTITNGTTASGDNDSSASGAVYIFRRSGTNWSSEAYIKAPNANSGDRFGNDLSLSADTLVVGAKAESSNQTFITNGSTASSDNSASSSGAVYVFKRTGTIWANEAYIKASNAGANDSFGASVRVVSDLIAVGALLEDSNQTTITNGTSSSNDDSLVNSGAVYIYKRVGTNWSQEAYIKASNADANDEFGSRLALTSDTLVVGAFKEDSNQTTITNGTNSSADNSFSSSGAIYVYKRQ